MHAISITDSIDGKQYRRDENVTCPLCGGDNAPRQIPIRFGLTASVAECAPCRLAYQTPRPSPEATLAYMNWRWSSSDSYVSNKAAQMKRARKQAAIVNSACSSFGSLLDFGAGAGSFVRACVDSGWTATGIERSESAIARAKEFYDVDLQTDAGEQKFDAVTLWDVIEHLRDPQDTLGYVRTLLKPGGKVFIETGNYEYWGRALDGDQWGLYLFDHQYYFTPSSLRQVVERAGFSNFRILPVNHRHPLLHVARRPLRAASAFRIWRDAHRRDPAHADIGIMVACAELNP